MSNEWPIVALGDIFAIARGGSPRPIQEFITDDPDGGSSFATAKARLPLPVFGAILRRPGEADAAGVSRPGLTLATRPRALVTAPWPATIRYLGP